MWLLSALGSALFAGMTAVLAKMGLQHVRSNLATAIRTGVVLLFAWLMVLLTGSQSGLPSLEMRPLVFLCLSGLATGGSWLCYFRALQLGDVSRVAPIDKSSIILTICLSFLLLGEPVSVCKFAGMLLIGTGTLLMIAPRANGQPGKAKKGWLLYALLSAAFASLTAILGKIGIEGVESNLGTAVRTGVVLVMAWVVVLISGEQREIRKIGRKGWAFLLLSGLTTGGSWLCYYRALQLGPASAVVAVDKLSIVITILFSRLLLGERPGRRALAGLALIVAGTLAMLL